MKYNVFYFLFVIFFIYLLIIGFASADMNKTTVKISLSGLSKTTASMSSSANTGGLTGHAIGTPATTSSATSVNVRNLNALRL